MTYRRHTFYQLRRRSRVKMDTVLQFVARNLIDNNLTLFQVIILTNIDPVQSRWVNTISAAKFQNVDHFEWRHLVEKVFSDRDLDKTCSTFLASSPANIVRNNYVIITSKWRFDVIVTYLLRSLFAGTVPVDVHLRPFGAMASAGIVLIKFFWRIYMRQVSQGYSSPPSAVYVRFSIGSDNDLSPIRRQAII